MMFGIELKLYAFVGVIMLITPVYYVYIEGFRLRLARPRAAQVQPEMAVAG